MKNTFSFLATTALATFVSQAQAGFEGFYTQVAIGGEGTEVHQSVTASADKMLTISQKQSVSHKQNLTVLTGGFYQSMESKDKLIGIGFDYSPSAKNFNGVSNTYTYSNSSMNQSTSNNSYKTSNRFNLFLSQAYLLDKESMAYGKLGISHEKLELKTPNGITETGINGPMFGFGYKKQLNEGFYGFAEYDGLVYQRKSLAVTSPTGLSGLVKPRLGTWQFMLGAGYNF